MRKTVKKKNIRAIVAADRNWAIGNNGSLLTNIPDDQRFFRQTTTGQVVIMGRKTLESLPQGKPLPNRTNIILTRNIDYKNKDVFVARSVNEALDLARRHGTDIYIAGGEEIYKAFLPYCEEAYVTYIDYSYQEAYDEFIAISGRRMRAEWETFESYRI